MTGTATTKQWTYKTRTFKSVRTLKYDEHMLSGGPCKCMHCRQSNVAILTDEAETVTIPATVGNSIQFACWHWISSYQKLKKLFSKWFALPESQYRTKNEQLWLVTTQTPQINADSLYSILYYTCNSFTSLSDCSRLRQNSLLQKEHLYPGFFKENVGYPVRTCRDPISLFLGTRFSVILGTRW